VAFDPEAGIDVMLGPVWSVQLGYQGSIGGDGTTNGGYLGVRASW
jgi:hypothetical protein